MHLYTKADIIALEKILAEIQPELLDSPVRYGRKTFAMMVKMTADVLDNYKRLLDEFKEEQEAPKAADTTTLHQLREKQADGYEFLRKHRHTQTCLEHNHKLGRIGHPIACTLPCEVSHKAALERLK